MTENTEIARETCINDLKNKGFIDKVKVNGDIIYTEHFYREMNRLMDAGKTSVAAYAELGFNPELFGDNRAMQAGKNARARKGYRFIPCNGTVPPSQVAGLDSMTVEDQLNYFRSRNIYLETLFEEIKKKELICGGEVLRIKLEFIPSRSIVMNMTESCIENFRREEAPAEYGLKNPLKQIEILTIFDIRESCWRSAMQRRQLWEAKLKKEAEEREIIEWHIVEIVRRYCSIPGKRVIHRELVARYGHTISSKRVKKIMNGMRLVPSIPWRNPYKFDATHDHPQTAPENLVNQNFFIAPRRVILTDITYLYYQKPLGTDKVFYLCVFKDAFTSEILGHSTSERMDISLVREAYEMMMNLHGDELQAVKQKGLAVLIHSDQGSQYLSTTFRRLLSDDKFVQSCSRRGNSQDNAPCESFFQKLKYIVRDPMFLCVSYEKCSEVVKGYIHHYNSNAVQTCLGGLTPENFYKYAVTGIYPFSDYFGVKPDITKTEDILKKQLQQRLEQQAKKALKKRQNHKNNQECGGGSGTVAEAPLERVDKDLALLERQLKWQMSIIHGSAKVNEYLEEHSLAAEAYLPFLNGLIQEARQAREYMVHLSETELEQLSKPGSWKGVPWLEYAEKNAHAVRLQASAYLPGGLSKAPAQGGLYHDKPQSLSVAELSGGKRDPRRRSIMRGLR